MYNDDITKAVKDAEDSEVAPRITLSLLEKGIGSASDKPSIERALQRARRANLLSYNVKRGWRTTTKGQQMLVDTDYYTTWFFPQRVTQAVVQA